MYTKNQVGSKYTFKYSVTAVSVDNKKEVSFWHDVPLKAANNTGGFNFVCEIPRSTRAKMEVVTELANTPIKQDTTSDGALRFYSSAIPWNYGMLPRTYEDPKHTTWPGMEGLPGDGDPLDVIEISKSRRAEIGDVYPVKVVGALALIDDGEVDWKILAIRADDEMASRVHDLGDVDAAELERIQVWFRDYKIKDGKAANSYGVGPQDAGSAKRVIAEAHQMYVGVSPPQPPTGARPRPRL